MKFNPVMPMLQGAKEFFTTLTTALGLTTKTDYRNESLPYTAKDSSVQIKGTVGLSTTKDQRTKTPIPGSC
jgi:hypothetical protein